MSPISSSPCPSPRTPRQPPSAAASPRTRLRGSGGVASSHFKFSEAALSVTPSSAQQEPPKSPGRIMTGGGGGGTRPYGRVASSPAAPWTPPAQRRVSPVRAGRGTSPSPQRCPSPGSGMENYFTWYITLNDLLSFRLSARMIVKCSSSIVLMNKPKIL